MSLEVHSPKADQLRQVLHALELEIMVKKAEIPRVVAVLEGSKGRLELSSFQPVPRGYVI